MSLVTSKHESEAAKGATILRSLPADAASSVGLALAVMALRFPVSIIIARSIGATGKGISTLLLLLVTQISLLLSVGVEASIMHLVGRQKRDLRHLMSSVVPLGIGLGTIGMALCLLAYKLLSDRLGELPSPLLILFASLVPLSIVASYLRAALRVSGRVVEDASLNLVHVVTTLLLLGAALSLNGGLKAVLLAQGGGIAIYFLVSLGLALRFRTIGRPVRNKADLQILCKYGLRSHTGSVLQTLNVRADIYFMAFILSNTAVGIYSVGVAIAELLLIVPMAMQAVLMHRVATRRETDLNTLMGPLNRLTSTGVAFLALVLALVGRYAISTLYGGTFESSYLPLLFLLPGIWALGLWTNMTNDLVVRGRPEVKSYTAAAAFTATLILNPLLVPSLGIVGAALASSIAYLVGFSSCLVMYCRATKQHIPEVIVGSAHDLRLLKARVRQLLPWDTKPTDAPTVAISTSETSARKELARRPPNVSDE